MAGEPSADKKRRARESLLSAVANSVPPANVPPRLIFGFALVQAGLIALTCLAVTAGAAAASGVNLRSVAGDVVDTLIEPLPLSAPLPTLAEGPQAPIGLDPVEQAAGDDPAGSVRTPGQAAKADADGLDAATSDDTNPPAQDGPFVPITKPGNHPPDDNPTVDDPPHGDNQGDDHGTPPDEIGPPAGNPSPGGPPDGNGQGGAGGSGNHGENGQPGVNGPNGDGSSGGGPDGSNGNPWTGADGGPDSLSEDPSGDPAGDGSGEQCGGGPGASNPGGRGGKGGSK